MKKVLMATANYWNSPFHVGSHHIAKGFMQAGWQVAFISDPISPFHILGGVSKELKERYENYISGGKEEFNHFWSYVPGALLTPNNKAILRSQWVANNWSHFSLPNVTKRVYAKGFGEVDLLYFDSPTQYFWLDAIHYKKSIFRIADNNKGFGKFTPALEKLEEKLARNVDTIVYTAKNLESMVRAMKPKSILHVPNGVNFNHFDKASRTIPQDLLQIPKPIALYVGAMDEWFDFELVNKAAEKLPHISFVLIGPEHLAKTKIKPHKNIYLLGRRSYNQLPQYLYNSDIGIIPFNRSAFPELVDGINPLKLYEYLSCGLPVVSIKWDELLHLNSPARLCDTHTDFISGIETMLSDLQTQNKSVNIEYARNMDWSKQIDKMIKGLDL